MNDDISHLIQYCILDLMSKVKPEYEVWLHSASKNLNEDPLGWLYLKNTEMVIKERMKQASVEMELFDDIYFAICWELRERSM